MCSIKRSMNNEVHSSVAISHISLDSAVASGSVYSKFRINRSNFSDII